MRKSHNHAVTVFGALLLVVVSTMTRADTSFIEAFHKHDVVKLLIEPKTGAIYEANQSAIDFYGYPTLTQMSIQQINQLSPEQVASERQLAEQEGRNFFIFRHKLQDGTIKTVEVHSSPVVYQGENLLLSIIRDISLQRDMQDELWHYQSHLENLVEVQTEKIQTRSKIIIFLMGIALLVSVLIISIMRRLIKIRKQSEFEIKKSKNLYDLAVEGTGVGIWSWKLAEDKHFWSEKYFDLLGLKTDEVTPSRKEVVKRIHPEDHELALTVLESHLSDDVRSEIVCRMLCADQEYRWVKIMAHVKRDDDGNPIEMAGSIQDVNDKKLKDLNLEQTTRDLKKEVSLRSEAERISKTQRDRLQVLLEQASDGIHLVNLQGDVVDCSRSFYSMLGYSKEEVMQLNVKDWEGQIPENEIKGAIADLIENPRTFETKHVKKNGEIYPAEVSTQVVVINNETLLYASARDITKRKQAEQELREAKIAAEQANAAKGEFLANMSHEIRTPMNGVLGVLDLLELRELDDKSQRLVDMATQSSKTLLSIINDVLDYSKIDANKLTLESTAFSVKTLIKSVFSSMASAAHKNRVKLTFTIADDFNDVWDGDPARVRQIVTNLLSNAIKFTCDGDVKVTLESPLHDEMRGLVISVKDQGIGMSPASINDIFSAFKQADSSTTRKFGGTGLGLAITKNLVQLMEGEISVESELGQGSTFTVNLPLPPSKCKATNQEKDAIHIPDFTNVKILVAEDNGINQEIINSMLEHTSATIEMADNGRDATEKYTAFSPDIILMDIQMPIMGGIEACENIRKLDRDVPIIAVTANVVREDVQTYLSKGFNAHVGKPISMSNLFKTVEGFIPS